MSKDAKGAVTKLERAAQEIIGYLVVLTICLVTLGVVARVMNIPVAWTDELLRALFIWLIFIGSAMAYKSGNLIGFDLLEEVLSKRPLLGRLLKLTQHIGALAFSGFLCVQTFRIISTQMQTGEFTPVVEIPLWFVNLGFFIGSVMFLIFALINMRNLLTRWRT